MPFAEVHEFTPLTKRPQRDPLLKAKIIDRPQLLRSEHDLKALVALPF
jgi:hypothetical protein